MTNPRIPATYRQELDVRPTFSELLDDEVHLLARLRPICAEVQNRDEGEIAA